MEREPPEPERLRVLFVNHVAEMAGAEQSLLDLLRHLNRERIAPSLAAPAGGRLTAEAQSLDVPVWPLALRRLRRLRNPVALANQATHMRLLGGELARLVDRKRVDVVHANSFSALAYACCGVPPDCPIIWHARDLRYPPLAARRFIPRAARIIAISQAVAEEVVRVCPGAEAVTEVIYNGIDPGPYEAARGAGLQTEPGLPPNSKLVGMVGQLVPWKRHDLFLNAAAVVALARPDVEFLIVGADLFGEHAKYRAELEDLAEELGITGRVHFLGWRTDIPRVLAALDVLVHPAEREPFGRVLLEAMAAGTPMVALDAGGPPEIITDGVDGLLLPVPTHPRELAGAVTRLLADEALAARLVSGGREKVRFLSAERMARLVQDCYADIVWEATEGS